jgi:hypothetical protein
MPGGKKSLNACLGKALSDWKLTTHWRKPQNSPIPRVSSISDRRDLLPFLSLDAIIQDIGATEP